MTTTDAGLPSDATRQRATRALSDLLGHERPRPGQAEAIAAVLDGHDTLAVLPTGSGKSAVYQVAATLMGGATLVVSPLIALQHDQVRAVEETDLGESAAANSSLSEHQRDSVLDASATGELEFLFLAPEQLARPDTIEQLRRARPSLVVIDEAHCVSGWGHDFRPDYLRIADTIEALGRPQVLALTATAAPPVRDEIVAALGLSDPVVVVESFDRPEITLAVQSFHDADEKTAAVVEAVAGRGGPGIVYVATRAHAEAVSTALVEVGCRAATYHAGLATTTRTEVQDAFLTGDLDVVVATNAFGMGIDKADVRFVFHHDVPGSLDAYYQEVGRAGRDGEPADGVLFWSPSDLGLHRFFAGGSIDAELLAQVAEAVDVAGGGTDVDELTARTGLSRRAVARAVNALVASGGLAVDGGADGSITRGERSIEDAVRDATATDEARHHVERSRIEMVRGYAETKGCRRQFLLNYFGEDLEPPCRNCDNCIAHPEASRGSEPAGGAAGDAADADFAVGSTVVHAEWGEGQVVRHEGGDRLTVLFDAVGYKVLALPVVREHDLLRPA